MAQNVIDLVVNAGLCVGCGVCAGVCPHENLLISFDKMGEFKARLIGKCPNNCCLCVEVCPRSAKNKNEDTITKQQFAKISGIKYAPETGYHLQCYSGFCSDELLRNKAASGGLTTLFLDQLIKSGEINGVICVRPINDPTKLFEFFIATSSEELWSAASSAYYPVELSGVIREIMKRDGTYAIVGLPCFLTALSLAQQNIPKLERKIQYKIGLVCGSLFSKKYVEIILAKLHIPKDMVHSIKFRDTGIFPNRLRGIKIKTQNGGVHIINNSMHGSAVRSGELTPTACMFCDDVFAETAHVTFMDAWLPEHRTEHLGTTLIIARDPRSIHFIEKIASDSIGNVRQINIRQIVASQQPGLINKRTYLKYRLELAKRWNIPFPIKRRFPVQKLTIKEKVKIRAKFYRHQKLRGLRIPPAERFSLLPSQLIYILMDSRFRLINFIRKIYFGYKYNK